MKEKRGYIFIHILGCIAFLALPVIFSPEFKNSELIKEPPFQRDFLGYLILILFFYFHYYFLIPRFLFKKKYFLYFSWILISFATITILPKIIINYMETFHPEFEILPDNLDNFSFHSRHVIQQIISHYFFQFLMVITFSFLLKIYNRWKQTEKEKLVTELSYLKAQMNPHFLFNTLNSIYSLAIQEKSNHTANAIVKLSGMMRYVFRESETDFILLEKEINYISDYIDLQKLRLEDTIDLSFEVSGDTSNKKIAPFLLIHFIENAFKYGVNPEKKSTVKLSINIVKNELTFIVDNNKVNTTFEASSKNGLGIENTKQRLQLLYPSSHQLIITEKETQFIVFLKLILK